MFDAGKTRMIVLPYGEKIMTIIKKPFSTDTGTLRTDRQICYINIARRDKNRFRKMFSVYTLLKRVHTDSQT